MTGRTVKNPPAKRGRAPGTGRSSVAGATAGASTAQRAAAISEKRADQLATIVEGDDHEIGESLRADEWPVNRGRGRPSLTAPGETSPQLTVRLSKKSYAAAKLLAESEGKSMSTLLRESLEARIASSPPPVVPVRRAASASRRESPR